jgi:hypothetical protein
MRVLIPGADSAAQYCRKAAQLPGEQYADERPASRRSKRPSCATALRRSSISIRAAKFSAGEFTEVLLARGVHVISTAGGIKLFTQ